MSAIENVLQTVNDNLESIPFYEDILDKWNEYAGDRFKTSNPYTKEGPDGKSHKLKLPDNATKTEKKAWKSIQRKAWVHDKCFLGCYPIDCGLGLAPLVILIPGVGPLLMWAVHARLISMADREFDLDSKTTAKLHANVIFDLLISLPPLIGSFLTWMNACSTRNAAIIHTRVTKLLVEKAEFEKRREEMALANNNRHQIPSKEYSNKVQSAQGRQQQRQLSAVYQSPV